MSYKAFDNHASEYDAWYDSEAGKAIFAMEADCIKPLLNGFKKPHLEIGVGSGRFARQLKVEYGIDPAIDLLRIAASRDIRTVRATGEKIPFKDGIFGGVLIALTICFVSDPLSVLQETWRILRPGGGLVLGLILKGSPWAEFYAAKGREGHPLYGRARFFSKDEIERLLKLSGFKALDYRSALFQLPGQSRYLPEHAVKGYRETAGFVAIGSHKDEVKKSIVLR